MFAQIPKCVAFSYWITGKFPVIKWKLEMHVILHTSLLGLIEKRTHFNFTNFEFNYAMKSKHESKHP